MKPGEFFLQAAIFLLPCIAISGDKAVLVPPGTVESAE
jgi:hypothetical protein